MTFCALHLYDCCLKLLTVSRYTSSSKTSPSRQAPGMNLSFESAAWSSIGEGWRPLFGRFRDLGVSFEWHEFNLEEPLDWSRSFHASSLELCLNLSGQAAVTCDRQTVRFESLTAGFYYAGNVGQLQAVRLPGELHRFLTVELSRDYVTNRLKDFQLGLHPLVHSVVVSDQGASCSGSVEPITPGLVELANSLRIPPVASQAQRLWFEGKAGELMAHLLFKPEGGEFFCTRQHRVAHERTIRVLEILKRDLASPPTLEALGKEIGCSPFYLSRTFSSQMGATIPQYLRKLRMDRAAELLESRRCNVTEAALEVGYSSLSHFSSAFQETFGCCPGLYPLDHSAAGRARG